LRHFAFGETLGPIGALIRGSTTLENQHMVPLRRASSAGSVGISLFSGNRRAR
jgi:hypothetical protein